jgi:hypothetical protein
MLLKMKYALTICLAILICASFPSRSDAAERTKVAEPCKHDEERDGVLCYPRCKSGYEGDGEECVEKCPANSQDYGNKCLMGPAAVLKKFYTRGPGRAVDE